VVIPEGDNLQKAIEEVIAPYDDLIENNRRRVELLESSARLLYQEWFVQLRFPGHEHINVVDGVPNGWRRLSVKECCQKVSYGYTASSSSEAIGPKFLRITDIVPTFINWDTVPYCEIDDLGRSKYKLEEGDIVVARTGATVGYAKRIAKTEHEVVYASYLVKFKPNTAILDDTLLGVFMESNSYKEFVRANAGGAAQPNANAQILGAAKLLIPTKNLQDIFRDYYRDIVSEKSVLERQSRLLAQARDLLLPRLMSGGITV
jgi:type I restriction enzyme S subunit